MNERNVINKKKFIRVFHPMAPRGCYQVRGKQNATRLKVKNTKMQRRKQLKISTA
jgi:hypothetical protein